MRPFHRLHRERQRIAIIRKMALQFGRPEVAEMARRYGAQLHGLAAMCRPADAGYLAARIGPNDMGPALDDLSASIKFERANFRASLMPVRRAA